MLKITADAARRRLVLEGSLSGAWIETLEESWRAANAENTARQVAVDLTDVTFVDGPGRQLLERIHEAGGTLLATGINTALIQEINHGVTP